MIKVQYISADISIISSENSCFFPEIINDTKLLIDGAVNF